MLSNFPHALKWPNTQISQCESCASDGSILLRKRKTLPCLRGAFVDRFRSVCFSRCVQNVYKAEKPRLNSKSNATILAASSAVLSSAFLSNAIPVSIHPHSIIQEAQSAIVSTGHEISRGASSFLFFDSHTAMGFCSGSAFSVV